MSSIVYKICKSTSTYMCQAMHRMYLQRVKITTTSTLLVFWFQQAHIDCECYGLNNTVIKDVVLFMDDIAYLW